MTDDIVQILKYIDRSLNMVNWCCTQYAELVQHRNDVINTDADPKDAEHERTVRLACQEMEILIPKIKLQLIAALNHAEMMLFVAKDKKPDVAGLKETLSQHFDRDNVFRELYGIANRVDSLVGLIIDSDYHGVADLVRWVATATTRSIDYAMNEEE